MPESANERIFRRIIEDGFNRGDLTTFDELVAADCVEHQAHPPGVPTVGPAAPRAVAESLRRAFPDLTLTIEDMSADGDKVWARIRSTGTHEGPFFGNAATHRRMAIDVIDIARFEDGKMVDHWGVADRLGVLVQLELAPRPGPASEALRSDH